MLGNRGVHALQRLRAARTVGQVIVDPLLLALEGRLLNGGRRLGRLAELPGLDNGQVLRLPLALLLLVQPRGECRVRGGASGQRLRRAQVDIRRLGGLLVMSCLQAPPSLTRGRRLSFGVRLCGGYGVHLLRHGQPVAEQEP